MEISLESHVREFRPAFNPLSWGLSPQGERRDPISKKTTNQKNYNYQTMKRTTRGEKILNQLVADPTHPLTEDGKNFLIQTLDPNHDRPFRKIGWVDNNTRPSVVRMVKQSMQISAVSGGGAPVLAPWDVHIAISPFSSGSSMSQVALRQNNALILTTGGNIMPFTGLRAVAQFSSGSPVVWTPTLGSSTYLGGLSVDPAYLSSDSRLVGIAFEVTDTSAEINKQGTLTAYAYPQNGPIDYYAAMTAGTSGQLNLGSFRGKRVIYPPTSQADALLLPDTKQWEAKFGSYSVPTFQDIHNPLSSNCSMVPVFEASTTKFDVNAVTGDPCYLSDIVAAVSTSSTLPGTVVTAKMVAPNYTHFFPINTSGVILSGLNPNSSFNVSMTYVMEEVPTLSDKASVVLTQPPPAFDPWVLNLYTHIVAHLPPAVYVAENDLGEWFWGIVEDISEAIGPVLGMIPHPIAQGASALANTIVRNKRVPKTPALPARAPTKKPKPLPPIPQKPKKKPLPPKPLPRVPK